MSAFVLVYIHELVKNCEQTAFQLFLGTAQSSELSSPVGLKFT